LPSSAVLSRFEPKRTAVTDLIAQILCGFSPGQPLLAEVLNEVVVISGAKETELAKVRGIGHGRRFVRELLWTLYVDLALKPMKDPVSRPSIVILSHRSIFRTKIVSPGGESGS
jgi:hypothetical protein